MANSKPEDSAADAEGKSISHNGELESFNRAIDAESFRLMVETIRDYGIFMLDPQGHILTWNLGAQRIKGYSARDVIGRHFSLFYTESDRQSNHPTKELEIAEREGRYEEEGWRVRKDGTRFWANIVISRLRNSGGQTIGFGKVTRDLSERKRAEELLRQSNETLERRVEERTRELTEAIRARDDFLSIASHELRTPVTPLKIQVQSLQRLLRAGKEGLDHNRLERMAATIDRSLVRIEKLIENLLDVARINSGRMQLHPEEVDLAELTRESVARQRMEARNSGSEVRLDIPNALPVYIDRLRFEQILLNLLTNAIKYGEAKPITVALALVGEEIILTVRDEGIGVAPENHERMFQRFERITNGLGAGGLGLGLFITKQIVDMHGGTIGVRSEAGFGSTLTVRLPYRAAP